MAAHIAARSSKPMALAAALGSAFALYPAASLRAEEASSKAPAVSQPAPDTTSASNTAKPTPVASASSAAPRLSIYDTPSAPIVLAPEAPSELQLQVSALRKTSQALYGDAKSRLRKVSSDWVGLENKVEHEVKSIVPGDESLTPGALYVGVSTLLGSILTRSRAFPIRFLAPPLALVASATYFLPKTAHNLNLYTQSLEKAYIPSVYSHQMAAVGEAKKLWYSAVSTGKDLQDRAGKLSTEGQKRFEQSSGLKLQSANSDSNALAARQKSEAELAASKGVKLV